MDETHGDAALGQPYFQTRVFLGRDFLSLSLRRDKSSKNLRNYMFSARWILLPTAQ